MRHFHKKKKKGLFSPSGITFLFLSTWSQAFEPKMSKIKTGRQIATISLLFVRWAWWEMSSARPGRWVGKGRFASRSPRCRGTALWLVAAQQYNWSWCYQLEWESNSWHIGGVAETQDLENTPKRTGIWKSEPRNRIPQEKAPGSAMYLSLQAVASIKSCRKRCLLQAQANIFILAYRKKLLSFALRANFSWRLFLI